MKQPNIFMVQPLPVKQFESGASFEDFASLFRISKTDYMTKIKNHPNLYHPSNSLLGLEESITFGKYFNERGITEETCEIIKIMINNQYYKDFDNLVKIYDPVKMAARTDFHKMPYHKFFLGEVFRNAHKYFNIQIESANKEEIFELAAYQQIIKTKFTKTIERFDEFVKALEEQLFSKLKNTKQNVAASKENTMCNYS